MAHAWLDSLSEDWVSLPRSDTSQAQLPVFSGPQSNSRYNTNLREQSSRLPRSSSQGAWKAYPTTSAHDEISPNVLSERSTNEIINNQSQRPPSKLSQDPRLAQRGRHLSRSVSASSVADSVIHNTVHHKSQSASPSKGRDSVPEWKRRLLYGDIAYGEAKDLFSNAGTGLENIFRPPPRAHHMPRDDGYAGNETTLPSSPPPYLPEDEDQGQSTLEQPSDGFSEIAPVSQPRGIKFRLNDDGHDDSSRPDESIAESRAQTHDTGTKQVSESSVTSVTNRPQFDASRQVSGRSELRHEAFSPIIFSCHDIQEGKVTFAPIELPADQLRKRLDKLRRNQMMLGSETESSEGQEPDAPTKNDPDNTDDYARHGGFLNLQRGGRSAEDSFRRRPLSPQLNNDTSDMLPESSLQASTPKQFPTVRTDRFVSTDRKDRPVTPPSPHVPPAPYPSPEKQVEPPRSSGGSPLKLFGPYDTFTNQTLLRRISQFEDQMIESPARSRDQSGDYSTRESHSKSEFNRGSVPGSSPRKSRQSTQVRQETFGAVNRFGAGQFDGYSFNEDISINSDMDNKENVAPDGDTLPPSRPFKFDMSYDSSASEGEEALVVRRRRHNKSSSTANASSRPSTKGSMVPGAHTNNAGNLVLATPKRNGSDGKRPRTSPSKDPTPKRRRTLHRSDIAYGQEGQPTDLAIVQNSHRHMQSAIGRKRKDARQGDQQQAANPSTMATRDILRPRTPTPSQRSSVQREREPLADIHLSTHDMSTSGSVDDESVISNEGFLFDGSRKTSMKTQDFFDEAEKIMAMIRSKARPQAVGGLASVEESEAEDAYRVATANQSDESFQDSTKEPFSRPPSRDGPPVSHMPSRQQDPELVDRLRKYAEVSDMGELITYSMRSMGLAKEAIQEVNKINQSVQESIRNSQMRHSSPAEGEVISDLPNVRLSRNPDATAYEATGEYSSRASQASGTSTGRSVPTASSRGSDSRRLIAPDVVSQLIGDQVGNMLLDKERNVWVKVKTPRPVSGGRNILPSEDSEDDPFASIPDLSVDVHKEQQHLGLKTRQLQDLEEFIQEDFSPARSSTKKSFVTEQSMDARSIMSHTKEALTKISETLAGTAADSDETVEHEITIHEDRVQNSTPSRRRNLTITFSSPIASIIDDAKPQGSDGEGEGEYETEEDLREMEPYVGNIAADSLRRGRHNKSERPLSSKSNSSNRSRSRSRSRGPVRTLSLRGQAFIARPVSRIDEQDEETTVHNSVSEQRQLSIRGESGLSGPDAEENHQASVSFVITTPVSARHSRTPLRATPTIANHVGTLSLSPLSEFTVNHEDQSFGLEVSYVVGDDYLVTGNRSRRVLSQAIRSLVEKITEVEPFEPDWNSMQSLDINGKQLRSLHKLDEFCSSVVTLDASNNSISYLDGVPDSVRNLKICDNQLSELTAWGHLTNLQYLDISNNQINSLYAFKDLVHLRNLRADNNQITSLEGIKFHDSLQVLRVRGNLIEDVDMDGATMHRLTELDLKGNQISSVKNIEHLTKLCTLNLEQNRLSTFGLTRGHQAVSCLKYLKLSRNNMTSLDVSCFPNLGILEADRNQLTSVTGFKRTRRLDSLSLREQKGETPLDMSFLAHACEVRKLFLSGNLLNEFNPPVDFLNLQYLELANCGLQCLPINVGQLMPNVRTLNLNFNAIEDISGLRYIPRLKKLLVAGNRFTDAVGTLAQLLAEFPHLSKLDLRDNPATQGFYPPLQTLVPVDGGETTDFDPFVLPDASKERDEAYTGRLDMGTKKRRRYHEIVLTKLCGRLKMLDGLAIDMQQVRRKDVVYHALVECGAFSVVGAGNKPASSSEGEK